jgi:hypothetical protein
MANLLCPCIDSNGVDLNAHTTGSCTGHTAGTWSRQTGVTGNAGIFISNRVRSGAAANANVRYANSSTPSDADYSVYGRVRVASNSGRAGVLGRMQSGNQDCYLGRYTGTAWEIGKIVGGTFSSLATSSATLTVGNDYDIELALSGSSLTLYVNGVSTVTTTDGSLSTTGSPGVFLFDSSTPTDTTGYHVTNWSFNDTVSGGSGYTSATPNWRHATARVRVAATALRDSTVRIRTAATAFRDAALRVRVGAGGFRNGTIRIRSAATAFRDAAVRLRAAATSYRDGSVRIRSAATAFRNATVRILVAAPGATTAYRDSTVRIRSAVAAWRDAGVRLAVRAQAFRDAAMRIRTVAPGARDATLRVRTAASAFANTTVRVAVQVRGFRDASVRVRSVAPGYRFAATRIIVSGPAVSPGTVHAGPQMLGSVHGGAESLGRVHGGPMQRVTV